MIDFDSFIIDEMDATKEEIEPLYRIYLTEMEQMIDQLISASMDNDSDTYKRLLHNVKGINANMRIDLLIDPVTSMYTKLLDNDFLDLNVSIHEIIEIFSKVKIEISNYFELE